MSDPKSEQDDLRTENARLRAELVLVAAACRAFVEVVRQRDETIEELKAACLIAAGELKELDLRFRQQVDVLELVSEQSAERVDAYKAIRADLGEGGAK